MNIKSSEYTITLSDEELVTLSFALHDAVLRRQTNNAALNENMVKNYTAMQVMLLNVLDKGANNGT